MSDVDLFVEVFPIEADAAPVLAAYTLTTDLPPDRIDRLGRRVAARLRKTYPGVWLWADGRLVTDAPRTAMELTITVDMLREQQPDRFAALGAIVEAADWQPDPITIADVVAKARMDPLAERMGTALRAGDSRVRNAYAEREHKLQSWSVAGEAALSISIASRLLYARDIATFLGKERDPDAIVEALAGLAVSAPPDGMRGQIVGALGPLGPLRDELLAIIDRKVKPMVEAAPEDDPVLVVQSGQYEMAYPASALRLVVRLPDLARFEVDRNAAIQTLQMQPDVRARYVRAVSDIAKEEGILANAYNSRARPDLFFSADFEMNLRFAENRVRPYQLDTLADDFAQRGAYKIHEDMYDNPVRVCVVNTLSFKIEDFVEAMQRHLKRYFQFNIEVVRERRVRVVSRENLASAVRVVEKEDPDIILVFFPDDTGGSDDEDSGDDNATAAYVRSLTLGRGLPTHVIYEATLNDPDAMGGIIMSILGKTGNAPFVLAEPLEATDFVVGLDLVSEPVKATGETRTTAIARVYKGDGEFVRYAVRELITSDEAPPYVLVRDLFPQRDYSGKRVMIHHDNGLDPDLVQALAVWAKAIKAQFHPVEIYRFGAPRVYALDGGKICQPPWGSAFKLNDAEALLVSTVPEANITPQPLRVRTLSAGGPPLPIERALRSVLVWTLLAYSGDRRPKLPVTVINTDQLAGWLRKGNTLGAGEGVVPFWL